MYVRVRVWWEMQALMEDESPCMNSCMHICFLCVCGSYQFMFLLSCTHMQMDFLEISACVCVCWMLWQCACAAVPFSSLLIDLVDPAA